MTILFLLSGATDFIVAAGNNDLAAEGPRVLSFNAVLTLLTWICFFIMFAVLKRFLWVPLLNSLRDREQLIAESVQRAEELKQEYRRINEIRHQILAEARDEARTIISQARTAAKHAAQAIEQKAREETKILWENTLHDLENQRRKALSLLKQESVDVAVKLAEKIIQKKLSEEEDMGLIRKSLAEIEKG